jgi:hypothetical protein
MNTEIKTSVTKIINDSIIEIYERDYPKLAASIRAIVANGESYGNFFLHIKRKFGKDYKTSITASASLTLFKHYTSNKK